MRWDEFQKTTELQQSAVTTTPHLPKWIPSTTGLLKLNIAIVVNSLGNMVGVGCVLRDESVKVFLLASLPMLGFSCWTGAAAVYICLVRTI